MIQLKNNTFTSDKRLDRIKQFDERSRNFPIREILVLKQRSYTWSCKAWLDQGAEGACVGFGWAHELAAKPKINAVNTKFAHDKIYLEAQKIDEYPGEDYEGTSVLAGAKVVKNLNYMAEYRWAFSLEEALSAIGYLGPVVIGINWYDSMFNPDAKGLIKVSGNIAGGHCILVNGVNLKSKLVRLHNSWGAGWGVNGEAYLSFDDFGRLLSEEGECCLPVGRKVITAKIISEE